MHSFQSEEAEARRGTMFLKGKKKMVTVTLICGMKILKLSKKKMKQKIFYGKMKRERKKTCL